jgi:DNA-binding IclR family transcriptional regulator
MGRAFLYGLPADERRALLKRLQLTYRKDEWRNVQSRMDAAFEMIAERGFCVSLGDRRPDVFAVGAPVTTSDGTVMAINCGGLPSEATADYLHNELGPRLALAASQISVEPHPRA